MIASGEVCEVCGLVTEAYPSRALPELAEEYHQSSTSALHKEFDESRTNQEKVGVDWRSFKLADVDSTNTVGLEIYQDVLFAKTDDFTAHYRMPPSSLPIKHGIVEGLFDEEGNPCSGIIAKTEDATP